MKITAYLVDAFTATSGLGNRAGVVLDAAGLEDWQMQEIAKIVNVSETAFVLPAAQTDHDLHVRYFTPTKEVPICGHATIATHYLRAQKLGLPTSEIRAKTGAGILPVNIDRHDGGVTVTMTQGAPELGKPFDTATRADIAEALDIGESDLHPDLPIQIASTGHSKIMVPLREKQVLDSLRPDMEKLGKISERVGCNGFFPSRWPRAEKIFSSRAACSHLPSVFLKIR